MRKTTAPIPANHAISTEAVFDSPATPRWSQALGRDDRPNTSAVGVSEREPLGSAVQVQDPCKPESSWVNRATRTARAVALIGFTSAGLLVVALSLERWWLADASEVAVRHVKAAQRLADTIMLEDERLTMSANLAAATGEARWQQRYEEHLPAMDAAILEATQLAPPEVARRFDEATRDANNRLVELERQVFAHLAEKRLDLAQSVLSSRAYAQQKENLAAGSAAFAVELQNAKEAELSAVKRRSWQIIAALSAFAASVFCFFWVRLNSHLARSERAFANEQSEVSRLALHDALTGLPNRRCLRMQLDRAIARSRREATGFALLIVDLDGFKSVNDGYGHAAGDAVLIEVGKRLMRRVRKDEFVARLGGDEFVVVLNPGHAADPLHAADRLIHALSQPIALTEAEVRVGASAGVAFFPADSNEPDGLMRKADLALYRAKNEGRATVRYFQESMDDDVRLRAALELDMRSAIENRQIVPYFQPIVNLGKGTLSGFEVLARWSHPARGNVAPDVFIPMAEANGQINALTLCVMRAALAEARDWDPGLAIAINLAPRQLRDETLVDALMGVLHETGFPPQRFEVEVTESALIADLDTARRVLLGLKRHGIRVALDDFGTGHSSLRHLAELSFDKIKIDRSFIRTLRQNKQSVIIVNAIIGLGRSLKLATTAEGIETVADAAILTDLGCTSGQGYLYSKAVPAAGARAYIERDRQAQLETARLRQGVALPSLS